MMQNTQTSTLTENDAIEMILKARYFAPGERIIEDMYNRVSHAIMKAGTDLASEVYHAMLNGVFLPNSPTLVNAGRNNGGTLSACFVLPIEDSLDGILKATHDMSLIHKAFGGTGFSFGHIRPEGSLINSTGGKACGPVKVLQLLNSTAEMVGQGGKRQGGNMGVLPVDHPDIHKWITCKKSMDLKHFNLSVSVTDDFMNKATADVSEGSKFSKQAILFNEICQNAWERGDPGLIFIDKINEGRPKSWTPIEATNPCGEQPLGFYESCNLGSLNLSKFVDENGFNTTEFEKSIEIAVRFLDNVIDKNVYPTEEIEQATLKTRNIGLGIMGWADCLIKMGISYQSQEALDLINTIGRILQTTADSTSYMLATEKGVYPACTDDTPKRRNYTLTTIAPTGTLSKLARCSPGIEPVYSWDMEIYTEQGIYKYTHPLKEMAYELGLENDTALRIPVEWHIRHQAQWQRWIDNAVSKTINLPEEATVEDVRRAFEQAYRSGCKGITVYRDRSKSEQVLSSSGSSSAEKERGRQAKTTKPHTFTCRPGRLYEVMSGCGKMFIWVDEENGKQYEVFVVSSGGCAANNESTGRILSDEMQRNVPIPDITRPLKKVKCINAMKNPNSQGNSCSDIIGKVLDEDFEIYYCEETVISTNQGDHCPQCNSIMVMTGGCSTGTCPVCGWSGCS